MRRCICCALLITLNCIDVKPIPCIDLTSGTDECDSPEICDNNSDCYDTADGYGCQCKSGFKRETAHTCIGKYMSSAI